MTCVSLDGWAVWGRMVMCIFMAESLCKPPENIPILFIGYTPMQNKKVLKRKEINSFKLRGRTTQRKIYFN